MGFKQKDEKGQPTQNPPSTPNDVVDVVTPPQPQPETNTSMNDQNPYQGPQGPYNQQPNFQQPPNFTPSANPDGTYNMGGRTTLRDVNYLYSSPISRFSLAENLIEFKNMLEAQLIKKINQPTLPKNFKFIVIDSNHERVYPISIVLLCYTDENNGVTHTSVFILAIEPNDPLGSTTKDNRNQFELDFVMSDIVNDALKQKIEQHVRQTMGYGSNQNMRVEVTGADLIPKEIKPDNEYYLRSLVSNAGIAIFVDCQEKLGKVGKFFNFADVDMTRDQIVASIASNEQGVETCNGLPIRSDLAIKIIPMGNNVQNTLGVVDTGVGKSMIDVHTYVDMVYSPPVNPVRQEYPNGPMVADNRHYNPVVVITRIEPKVDIHSLEWFLFGILQSAILNMNKAWATAFFPNSSVKGDMKDIGGIGLETNVFGLKEWTPDRIKTKSAQFTNEYFFKMINEAFRDQVIYRMDVEELGDYSWLLNTFVDASEKNYIRGEYEMRTIDEENGKKQFAIKRIIEAANNLFSIRAPNGELYNNIFSSVFFSKKNHRIAYDNGKKIHLGYIMQDGVKYDIRTIDHLFLLNKLGVKEKEMVDHWDLSLELNSHPPTLYTRTRQQILKHLFPNQVVFKGYARRITFSADFILSLVEAAKQCNLAINANNIANNEASDYFKGMRNIDQYGLSPSSFGDNSIFRQGPSYGRGGYADNGAFNRYI